MNQFTLDTTVADIVRDVPQTGDLFRNLRIDFCCGGKIPLSEAAAGRGLDAEAVLVQVNEVADKQSAHEQKKPSSFEPAELILHIQDKYHSKIREELPLLAPYVTKLARVHGERYPYVNRVREIYLALKSELTDHTEDEDNNVFPLINNFFANPTEENREALKPHLEELESEHEAAGDLLKELRTITNGFQPPEDACGTHRLVIARLQELEGDTFEHIHLENNVLFERARQVI
ncbi:iron-sulfur cluster repair di-iron protein [Indiicoccus explosivorum]|uniref:iron-sulfur cluster repair di-iron protein n=1 Tax=Indiicoccus explosivorum TaxID=1917864 RepID=UPI000B446733|nr:iron-sulfur cluster repair di-iron protein [Indiicoccus explosivorum]